MKEVSILLITCVLFLITACDSAERDWKSTQQTNTTAAYADFLTKHPASAHKVEAELIIDGHDWKAAQQVNTTTAYAAFLSKHPASAHKAEAERIIDDLKTNPSDDAIRAAICKTGVTRVSEVRRMPYDHASKSLLVITKGKIIEEHTVLRFWNRKYRLTIGQDEVWTAKQEGPNNEGIWMTPEQDRAAGN